MRRLIKAVIISALIATTSATAAMAKDVLLDKQIDKIEYKIDKNGNAYARTFIREPRSLNGIEYTASVTVMFFGATVDELKTANYAKGDTVRMIAQENEYKGRISYNVLALIK